MSTDALERTDATTGLEILEGVDLTLEPGCESKSHPEGRWGHTGPAELKIRISGTCGTCRHDVVDKTLLFCRGGWDYAFRSGLRCDGCSAHHAREDFWTLLEVL